MNVLYLFSDNHNPILTRLHGGIGEMPHLERLARRGMCFDAAYCNYPLCVPSRGSMFAGRYASELGLWANAFTWNGQPRGWTHHLRERGTHLAAIGKLHFEHGGDYGFHEEIQTHHQDSSRRFDPHSLLRDKHTPVWERNYMSSNWGSAPREGMEYDSSMSVACKTSDLAIDWLRQNSRKKDNWMLYVGYKRIHPPWRARPDLFEKYRNKIKSLAPKYLQGADELHEVDRILAEHTCGYRGTDDALKDIHACYYAAMEEFDHELGRVIDAATEELDADNLCIIYSSDHGEMLRAHGKWGKLTLYEDSIRVPLVIVHPDGRARHGQSCPHPVSLLDVMPTINEVTGGKPMHDFRGRSLLPWVTATGDRPVHGYGVLAEAHGNAWPCSGFALRMGPWKWVEYVGYRSALFNLRDDPDEMDDLVKRHGSESHPEIAAVTSDLRRVLRQHLDPETVNRRAFADQAAKRGALDAEGRLRPLLAHYHIPESVLDI